MSDVVVTGIGLISVHGVGSKDMGGDASVQGPAAHVPEFDPAEHLGSKKGLRAMSRAARMLAVTTKLAMDDAGIAVDESNAASIGLVTGTMFGSVHSISSFDWTTLTDGPKYVNPMHFPNTVINSPAGHVGIKHDLRGLNSTISAGLTSGLAALDYGARLVSEKRVSAVVAGGLDELCEQSELAFGHICAPATLSEGVALLVLEKEQSASDRGAKSLGHLRGYGSAHAGRSSADAEGLTEAGVTAIKQALREASLEPSDIHLVSSAANGDPRLDGPEDRALQEVLGTQVASLRPKRSLGETMGASGAFAVVAALAALESGQNALVTGLDPQGNSAAMVVGKG